MIGKWTETENGTLVQDNSGRLWRVAGYIDRPAVLLQPLKEVGHPLTQADTRTQMTLVMDSLLADEFHPLKRADKAA